MKIKAHFGGLLPKGPSPPYLRMADRALLAGYPRLVRYSVQPESLKIAKAETLRSLSMAISLAVLVEENTSCGVFSLPRRISVLGGNL